CAHGSRSCSCAGRGSGRTRRARSSRRARSRRCSLRRASVASSTCGATTCRTTGRRGAPRCRIISRALSDVRLIGLLLGTEEDWRGAFESPGARLGPVRGRTLATERILNEPFDLRATPRYSLVIDRLAWWYDLPREWLKKVSLMNDVYLLNNPFTFQS